MKIFGNMKLKLYTILVRRRDGIGDVAAYVKIGDRRDRVSRGMNIGREWSIISLHPHIPRIRKLAKMRDISSRAAFRRMCREKKVDTTYSSIVSTYEYCKRQNAIEDGTFKFEFQRINTPGCKIEVDFKRSVGEGIFNPNEMKFYAYARIKQIK